MKHARLKAGQAGITMLEVLIALLVLTVGLAGLAALQLNSLQHVHSAHYRSLASTIALDFEERLWLELADNSLSGCPDASAASGSAADDLKTAWARTTLDGGTMLRVPNLVVTMGTSVFDTDSTIVTVPVTLSWGESRFTDAGESGTETFSYNVRIMCRRAPAT